MPGKHQAPRATSAQASTEASAAGPSPEDVAWSAWGNAAQQEDVTTGAMPGPWAPEVLDQASARGELSPVCDASAPWAAPLDTNVDGDPDGGSPEPRLAAETVAAPPPDPGPGAPPPDPRDPLGHAKNPIARAGDPAKTAKKAARFKHDLVDRSEHEGQGVEKVSTTISHDRADLRVQYGGPSDPEASGGGEHVLRASGGDLFVGRGISSEDADGNKQSSQVLVGTGGAAWEGSQELRSADGRTDSLKGGMSVGDGGVKGNVKLGTSGPKHTGMLGDPGRATRVTDSGQHGSTPDLAREIRDPRSSLSVSTSASASMTGGINVTAKLAGRSAAGDWLVAYTVPVDHRVAVDVAAKIDKIDHLAAGGPAKAGSPVSISASVGRSGQVELSGTRAFSSKEQAEAWAASPRYVDLIEVPVGAANVASLRIGERRRVAGSIGLDAGVSVSGGSLGGDLGAGGNAGVALDVFREDARWTTVTLDGHISGHAALSLGAPLLTVGGQAHAATLRRVTFRFDLGDDEAQRAYDALLLGTLPTPSTSVVGPLDVQQTVTGQAASATTPFGTVSSGGRSSTTDIARPDGSRTVVDEGAQVQGFSGSKWLSWFGLDDTDTENARGLAARTDLDATGSERDSRVKAVGVADSKDAGRVWDELALFDMRGAPPTAGDAQATGGEWRLTLLWGQGSLDELAQKVREDDPALVARAPAAYQDFYRAINEAGDDRDAKRAALKVYGESGLPARANLQRLLGTEGRETHLEREGCEVWIGVEGWVLDEGDLVLAQESSTHDPGSAQKAVLDLHLRHLDRLDSLKDWSRFREVPAPVREDEIARTRSFITRTERLLATVDAAIATEDVSIDSASTDAGDAGGLTTALTDGAVEDLTAAQKIATESKADADRAYKAVRHIEKLHMVGIEYNHASRWWRLAKSSYFGFVVDGPEAESYRQAEEHKVDGEEARREGVAAESDARFEQRHGNLPTATVQTHHAAKHYTSAESRFVKSKDTLKRIEEDERKADR